MTASYGHWARSRGAAVAEYRAARTAYFAACERADAAFVRYMTKLQAGERTSGAAYSRLSNLANEASVALYQAQSRVFAHELDPWDYDDADGVERTVIA